MSNLQLLNNVDHKDICIDTSYIRGEVYSFGNVATFPTEFMDVQREYPILFAETNDGLQCVALLGFDKEENLFLDDGEWDAHYIPAVVEMGPFKIGVHSGESLKVHIDVDDPRVGSIGQPLFLEFGGNTDYLDRIRTILAAVNDGVQLARKMFAVFKDLKLIDPVSLEYTLADGQKHQLNGFLTINQERLSSLTEEEVMKLHKSGFMPAAYFVVASLRNVEKLIKIKNKKIMD